MKTIIFDLTNIGETGDDKDGEFVDMPERIDLEEELLNHLGKVVRVTISEVRERKSPARKRIVARRFTPRNKYRFIEDFTFDIGYPVPRVECHTGDIATFDGRGLNGTGRFYVKQGNIYQLIIVNRKDVFKIFEDYTPPRSDA